MIFHRHRSVNRRGQRHTSLDTPGMNLSPEFLANVSWIRKQLPWPLLLCSVSFHSGLRRSLTENQHAHGPLCHTGQASTHPGPLGRTQVPGACSHLTSGAMVTLFPKLGSSKTPHTGSTPSPTSSSPGPRASGILQALFLTDALAHFHQVGKLG